MPKLVYKIPLSAIVMYKSHNYIAPVHLYIVVCARVCVCVVHCRMSRNCSIRHDGQPYSGHQERPVRGRAGGKGMYIYIYIGVYRYTQ